MRYALVKREPNVSMLRDQRQIHKGKVMQCSLAEAVFVESRSSTESPEECGLSAHGRGAGEARDGGRNQRIRARVRLVASGSSAAAETAGTCARSGGPGGMPRRVAVP